MIQSRRALDSIFHPRGRVGLLYLWKRLIAQLRGRLPSSLPKGRQEFDTFAVSLFTTYNLPDKPSYRHAIATMIMHQDPTTDRMPKHWFAKSIRKAQANEVAYQMIQEMNREEDEKRKAELHEGSLHALPSKEVV